MPQTRWANSIRVSLISVTALFPQQFWEKVGCHIPKFCDACSQWIVDEQTTVWTDKITLLIPDNCRRPPKYGDEPKFNRSLFGYDILPKRDTAGSTVVRRPVHALPPQAIRHSLAVFHLDVSCVPRLPFVAPGNQIRHQTGFCSRAFRRLSPSVPDLRGVVQRH